MPRRIAALLLLLPALLAGTAAWVASGSSGRAPLPSIVLVTLDTTRTDRLGCYGYFPNTSPNLDRFTEQCVLFENCVVPVATTLPTHCSILTGVYLIEHVVL